jgi:hypothetical protein
MYPPTKRNLTKTRKGRRNRDKGDKKKGREENFDIIR